MNRTAQTRASERSLRYYSGIGRDHFVKTSRPIRYSSLFVISTIISSRSSGRFDRIARSSVMLGDSPCAEHRVVLGKADAMHSMREEVRLDRDVGPGQVAIKFGH
jgi:hypothetical protein